MFEQPSDEVDRDFCFLLNAFDIEPGSYTPKVMTMLDFNLWAWNSRIFPGIDSQRAAEGQGTHPHRQPDDDEPPIHLHGHEFLITGTDGGPTPKSTRRPLISHSPRLQACLMLFIDTPGHARHHHCIWDERSRGFFTGDTFGLSYREFDTVRGPWLLPTSTPVQFEPDALRESVRRLLAFHPQWMYLTHFGPVGQVQALGTQLLEQIEEMVELGHTLRRAPQRHEAIKEGLARLYLRRVRAHGCDMPEARVLELLAMDIELNAQGLGIWLDRPDTP